MTSLLAKLGAAVGTTVILPLGLAALPASAASSIGSTSSATAPVTVPTNEGAAPDTGSNCYSGYVCYFYQSNFAGSAGGVGGNVPDLLYPQVYTFVSSGAGQGDAIGNDAGSAFNGNPRYAANIYYSANYQGVYIQLAPYNAPGFANPTLGPVNNNNRSQAFV